MSWSIFRGFRINRGTPLFIINSTGIFSNESHPFLGTPILGTPHMFFCFTNCSWRRQVISECREIWPMISFFQKIPRSKILKGGYSWKWCTPKNTGSRPSNDIYIYIYTHPINPCKRSIWSMILEKMMTKHHKCWGTLQFSAKSSSPQVHS